MAHRLGRVGLYTWLALIGICLLGLALRLYCLDCHGLWYDELASVEAAQRGLSAIFTDRFGWLHTQTPLHYLIVWLTTLPLDPALSAVPVRLPSALAGALTIPVVFALGTQLFHPVSTSTTQPAQTAGAREKARWVGLVGAGLVGLSAVHLNYSQDARPYALLTLLTTLSVYCLLRAERAGFGGHGHANRWWLGFGVVCALNLLNAYIALTLVMPAVLPYLLWVLYSLFAQRRQGRVQLPRHGSTRRHHRWLLYPSTALAVIGLASIGAIVDMNEVAHRTPPDMGAFRVGWLVSSPVELVSWFTRLGAGGQVERAVQMALLLLAIWGVYGAVRAGAGRGALLCALLIVVPSALLAVLSTSNVIFQRYALFALPFYFLLVANGMVCFVSMRPDRASAAKVARAVRAAGLALCAAAGLSVAVGAWVYTTSDHHRGAVVIDRMDFRSAARYLSEHALPGDTIVFAAANPSVGDFYWRGKPPAAVFDLLDPRLLQHRPAGSVYWLVGDNTPMDIEPSLGWSEVAYFGRITIFRQDGPGVDIGRTLAQLADTFERQNPPGRHTEFVANVWRGCVYQADGRIEQAAHAYRKAGTFFPIGEEYLYTSRGWAERGETGKALRDALLAKGHEPYRPEVHFWLAELFSRMGYAHLANDEERVAQALLAKTGR